MITTVLIGNESNISACSAFFAGNFLNETMKISRPIIFAILLTFLTFFIHAADIKDGKDLIAAMHKKYNKKWYRTLTFVQKTTTIKPDGSTNVEIWYEAMQIPGKLRIDIAPLEKGNGVIFADGKITSFRDGKNINSREFVHPLLALGFDVYGQPAEKTIEQVSSLSIDMSVIRKDKWQGRDVYVVGAKSGDTKSPQFWIDKKNLYFVRLIEVKGNNKNIHEIQFNKYEKLKGGWIAPEVIFFVDGKKTMIEEYSDMQADIPLSELLWDTNSWMTAPRDYFKIK